MAPLFRFLIPTPSSDPLPAIARQGAGKFMKTAEELTKELEEVRQQHAENIKALQQKLTDGDIASKKLKGELEEALKKLEEAGKQQPGNEQLAPLLKQIETLTASVQTLSNEKESSVLREKYPDILPRLLLGKSPEEQEAIVKDQREIMQKHYGSAPSPHMPKYKDASEIDERIKVVKADSSMSASEKILEIENLKEERSKFDAGS